MTNIENNINNILNPLTNNLNNGVQYAQNNLSSMANDVTHNPNYISDNDLYKKMWNNIQEFERVKTHPYLDSKGYITTGAGANINNLKTIMILMASLTMFIAQMLVRKEMIGLKEWLA